MTRVLAAGLSDVGRVRQENEDDFGDFEPEDLSRRFGRLLIVADGVGGHRGGKLASHLAVKTVSEAYYSTETLPRSRSGGDPTIEDRLLFSFHEANRRIYLRALEDQAVRGMASTCTALVLYAGRCFAAHLGDSRAYLVRGGAIRRLTHDHSVVQHQIDAGLLTHEEALTHPDRNIITRSMGFEPEVEPDLLQPPVTIQASDHFVLTTDGLHGLLSDELIGRTVQELEPMEACRRLVADANDHGGTDNITVQILRIEEA